MIGGACSLWICNNMKEPLDFEYRRAHEFDFAKPMLDFGTDLDRMALQVNCPHEPARSGHCTRVFGESWNGGILKSGSNLQPRKRTVWFRLS